MKKIQSYIVRTFLTVCLVVGASGCNYLDVVPPETADLSDTMKDKSDAIDFLYSCYSTAGISIPLNTLGGLEASADEYVNPLLWGRLGQIASWDQLSSTYQSNLGIFQLPWTLMYNALGQCNLFEKILSETSPKGVTLSDRERWTAEIKFLRAYYHFRLLEAYGPIPIIHHYYPTDTSKDQLPGRSHFDFCVDKIVGWLDEAA
ncbi:RagB/SusD family nutrient uptake outer membrane protein, partial [uncultured Duncaniella sp.]|uniref:RagB/SusD family nutrient uptake outer membrane protein n=1 Tax=uncultured Duncaniella sp. TaxID=2768039 RepID=UPI0026F14D2E